MLGVPGQILEGFFRRDCLFRSFVLDHIGDPVFLGENVAEPFRYKTIVED